MCGLNSTGYLVYNLAYLELFPDFICTTTDGSIQECSANPQPGGLSFCNNPDVVSFTTTPTSENFQQDTSFNNWVQFLNLYCVEPQKIALIGSMFFLGWCLSCLIIPPIADQIGRKKIAMIGLSVQWVVFTCVMFNHRLGVTYVLWFIMGIVASTRIPVAYCLGVELLP